MPEAAWRQLSPIDDDFDLGLEAKDDHQAFSTPKVRPPAIPGALLDAGLHSHGLDWIAGDGGSRNARAAHHLLEQL